MSHASVVSIFVAPDRGEPCTEVSEIEAKVEQGLEGDRKFIASPSADEPSKRQLTLIEIEEIERFNAMEQVDPMQPSEFRRQIVTTGVRLNDLADREFLVGDVRVRGTMLCEPCKYLSKLTGRDVLRGLAGRGGLCAQILTSGTIRQGDVIRVDAE